MIRVGEVEMSSMISSHFLLGKLIEKSYLARKKIEGAIEDFRGFEATCRVSNMSWDCFIYILDSSNSQASLKV